MGSLPLRRPRSRRLSGGRLIGIVEPGVGVPAEESLTSTAKLVHITLTGDSSPYRAVQARSGRGGPNRTLRAGGLGAPQTRERSRSASRLQALHTGGTAAAARMMGDSSNAVFWHHGVRLQARFSPCRPRRRAPGRASPRVAVLPLWNRRRGASRAQVSVADAIPPPRAVSCPSAPPGAEWACRRFVEYMLGGRKRTTQERGVALRQLGPRLDRGRRRQRGGGAVAERIHREAIVVDGHNDVTTWILDFGYDLGMNGADPAKRRAELYGPRSPASSPEGRSVAHRH